MVRPSALACFSLPSDLNLPTLLVPTVHRVKTLLRLRPASLLSVRLATTTLYGLLGVSALTRTTVFVAPVEVP